MSQNVLIIAGEKSGEEHSLSFMPELQNKLPHVKFFGVGGDQLQKRGVELLYHMNDFSSIGISNVIGKIPFYMKAMSHILDEVKKRKVKTAILIDFQTFNLKLAKKLKKRGVKVLYYVAPQAWVWKAYRAKTLANTVHTLFCILPFEKKWFQDRGVVQVKSVAHPLAINYKEELEKFSKKKASNFSNRKPRILLLPGSRSSELIHILPTFEKAIELLKETVPEIEVGILKADSVKEELFQELCPRVDQTFDNNRMVESFAWADMGLAASGTVTLATGLFGLPVVVAYRMSLANEFIMGSLISYEGPISLTNIVHNEMVYPEYIQHEANRYNLSRHLKNWIFDNDLYNSKCNLLETTKSKLFGEDFNVADYMASIIEGD
jgi:lipid-A-disaccharide synthase